MPRYLDFAGVRRQQETARRLARATYGPAGPGRNCAHRCCLVVFTLDLGEAGAGADRSTAGWRFSAILSARRAILWHLRGTQEIHTGSGGFLRSHVGRAGLCTAQRVLELAVCFCESNSRLLSTSHTNTSCSTLVSASEERESLSQSR